MKRGRRWRVTVWSACAAGLLFSSACRKRAAEEGAASAGSAQAQPTTFNTSMMEGADQSAIRAYLNSVHEVKPKKFEVQWSDSVVPVSREEALRSLRAISRDGDSYTFAAADPIVQKLQPGRLVWIWGLTIARIDLAGAIDSEFTIHTVPVSLSEALPKADIEFDSPVDYSTAISRTARRSPLPDSAWKNLTLAPAPSLFRDVAYRPGSPVIGPVAGQGGQGGAGENGGQASSDEATAEEDVVAARGGGYNGDIAGWEYSMAYAAGGGTLQFELEGRKMEEGGPTKGASNEMLRDERYEFYEDVKEQRHAEQEAEEAHERMLKDVEKLSQVANRPTPPPPSNASANQKAGLDFLNKKELQDDLEEAHKEYEAAEAAAKAAEQKAKNLAALKSMARNVFFIISDNLDVRFRAHADIDPMSVAAVITTGVAGPVPNAGSSVSFTGLKGKIDFEYVARLGEGGTGDVSLPIAHIPVVFNIPLIVSGIPFIVQVGGDFLFKVGLSGNHAAHHFHAKFDFDGQGGGLNVTTQSQANTNFSLSGSEPEVLETTAESPGVSGVVIAVQIPRVGLGVGVFGLAAMGFVDHVVVITVTNSAAVAALNPPCKRVTIDRVAHIGADLTTVMPIPIVETLSHFLAWKKEVWKAPQWIHVDPDIKMCRI